MLFTAKKWSSFLCLILSGVFITVLIVKNIFYYENTYREMQDRLQNIREYIRSTYSVPKFYSLTSKESTQEVVYILKKQRNDLSKEINKLKRLIGQIQCQVISQEGEQKSHSGGWCNQQSKEDSGLHVTDKELGGALAELFKGKRVASFGDGPGRYKKILEGSGKDVTYDAFDGAPFCEETSDGRVKFMDLTLPQFGLSMYDWVISLEVAEHIPKEFEKIYLDNINRHAREGVVLSWAVPGQGGYGHVNERSFDYVVKVMEKIDLYHDSEKSEFLRKAASVQWLKDNVNVFMRGNKTKLDIVDKFLV